jgi:hypothetical protein
MRFLLSALLSIGFFACEGPEGPMGPEGPVGPVGQQGPPGSTSFTVLTFALDESLYEDGVLRLIDSKITKTNVLGLHLSTERDGVEIWSPLTNMSSQYSNAVLGDIILDSSSRILEDVFVFFLIADGGIRITDKNRFFMQTVRDWGFEEIKVVLLVD